MTDNLMTAQLRRPSNDREPPLRLTPDRGTPRCLLEHVGQHIWRHPRFWYTAMVAAAAAGLQLGVGPYLHNLVS